MDVLGRKEARDQHCGTEYQDMTIPGYEHNNREDSLDRDTAKPVSTADRHKGHSDIAQIGRNDASGP